MANISISLEGIDQAIENLKYRPGSVKQRAILAIRSFYESEDSGEFATPLDYINADDLISSIWDVGGNRSKIKSKRRNFSSVKSSINADLEKLSKKGMNTENIIIADSNLFDMSEEAKNNLLNSFTDAVKTGDIDLDQATVLLKTVTDFLENFQLDDEKTDSSNIVDQIKKILNKITEDVLSEEELEDTPGLRKLKQGDIPFEEEDEELEEIDELDDGEAYEEDGELEEIEIDEDEELDELEEVEVDDLLDDDVEEIELEDDEELEEIEEFDEDEYDSGEDEELEEVEEDGLSDDDVEEIELDEDEALEEIDELDDEYEEDEELEEIEIDEDEELDELEEVEVDDLLDDDVEEIELEDDEELEEIEEFDEDEYDSEEDEELEEIEIDEDEALEEIDEDEEFDDEALEEVELDDDEELEELEDVGEEDAFDEDVEEIDLDEDEELEEIDELDEEELKALEDFREKRELAEHFDNALGEREKKFNQYVTVPEGMYTIGTQKGIKASLEFQQFEMPKVFIGVYPVTNSLFEIFIEETGFTTTAEKSGFGRVYTSRFKKNGKESAWSKNAGSKDVEGANWFQPTGPGSTLHGKRNHPVVQVSVEDAIAFASWIGRCIPTEAEWESAARTDMGYKYPWGNEFNPDAFNIEKSGICDTSAVDEYDPFLNEFKIADMLGNVYEWTSDMEYPSIKTSRKSKFCIAKGAAWNAKQDVSISSRALFKPGFTANIIGFRCISEIFL